MLVLITYDVNTETAAGKKRLRKVAKQCTNYGRRVQNSVFECIVDHAQCVALKAILTSLPAWGVWIEILINDNVEVESASLPAWGVWIEIWTKN